MTFTHRDEVSKVRSARAPAHRKNTGVSSSIIELIGSPRRRASIRTLTAASEADPMNKEKHEDGYTNEHDPSWLLQRQRIINVLQQHGRRRADLANNPIHSFIHSISHFIDV